MSALPPLRATLRSPEPFLSFLASHLDGIDLSDFSLVEMWALAAVGALARSGRDHPLPVSWEEHTNARKFALAVGFDDAMYARTGPVVGTPGRTVRLTPVIDEDDIEPVAREVAVLLAGVEQESDSARWTLSYVITELLRNVLQHSDDPLGGLVGAQRNDSGLHESQPVYQVVVADAGQGIRESLARHHDDVPDDRAALEYALRPHISGSFAEGRSGSERNAGLGLFFVSEMAKEAGGRLLVSSMSASIIVDSALQKRADLLPVGYPGTLVVFEVPVELPVEFAEMFERIRSRAQARKPKRLRSGWLRFDEPPPDAAKFLVSAFLENNEKARKLADEQIIPSLVKKCPVALNFVNVSVVTQSFVHALLYEPLRHAWASQTPIFVTNAQSFVRSAVEYVQDYAQGG